MNHSVYRAAERACAFLFAVYRAVRDSNAMRSLSFSRSLPPSFPLNCHSSAGIVAAEQLSEAATGRKYEKCYKQSAGQQLPRKSVRIDGKEIN